MEHYKSIYFVGAGGIGMSALERYCLAKGMKVAGYDKTPSHLTDQLQSEGIELFFDEDEDSIPSYCKNPENTLVIYTPAIPENHKGLEYFRNNGFKVIKRSELLGLITSSSKGLCFAGTHGKTTTSSMAAHIFHQSAIGCNAFLGGILKNYDSNLILSETSPFSIIEADEYDRSFHRLHPYMAVITATDPDHFDIYGNEEAYLESFSHFTSLIQPGGCLIMKKGIKAIPRVQEGVKIYQYSANKGGDFHAEHIRIGNGQIIFDFIAPGDSIPDIELGVPVEINIENAVASIAIAWLNGIPAQDIRKAMASFKGAKRRFDFWVKEKNIVMIDDYAHHPTELRATLNTAKEMGYKRLIAVHQPFTYSRTKMLFNDFVDVLKIPDITVLTPIMGSREPNDPTITSAKLAAQIPGSVLVNSLEEAAEWVKQNAREGDLVITLGCGDIYKASKMMVADNQ